MAIADFLSSIKGPSRRKEISSPIPISPQESPKIEAGFTNTPLVAIQTLPPIGKGSGRWSRIVSRSRPKPATGTPPNGKKDLIQLLQLVEEKFGQLFEDAEIEPLDREYRFQRPFRKQRDAYKWQEPSAQDPRYPPCLLSILKEEQASILQIFNPARFIDTAVSLIEDVPNLIYGLLFGRPIGPTLSSMEARNRILRQEKKNIGSEPSIADRSDWHSDAVFAQQTFTGPNPTTITLASAEWIERFAEAAKRQENVLMHALVTNAEAGSVYIQDYSYFRDAINAAPDSILTSDDKKRFGCAAVTLFLLTDDGSLHPLAIVLDYRIKMENSVVIFNKRHSPSDPITSEASDWPWRFAKMCNQVSDWTARELTVHLTYCHFVEEVTIVAANRSFPTDHVVFNLLEPHWLKTLSLNAAARATLVPDVVVNINGFTKTQTFDFILDAYKRWDWEAHYIPTDLERRGFPLAKLNDKIFHNCAWARNMVLMWETLYTFVSTTLKGVYKTDLDVAADLAVANWCAEMHSPTGGQMSSFPDIKTIHDLTNAVVMCIHIASPQHNSVNYLQCYYMSFIPSKPASLMAALPTSLSALMSYKEADIVKALPTKNSQVWFMSSQLPYLLSYGVAEDQTLISYASALEDEAREKKAKDNKWDVIEGAAKVFYDDLLGLGVKFNQNSEDMDDQIVAYRVMDPTKLAVSVLI